ncbi:hypothetical protein [Nitrosopumilus sp. b1]|nr:hypothetical protein [Nitrosopumilus sp. b1]
MRDEGCPTCGSKNFGTIDMKRQNDSSKWKMQCYNCKKFWYEVKSSN